MSKKKKTVPPLSNKKIKKKPRIVENPWKDHPTWLFNCFDCDLEFPDKSKKHDQAFIELARHLKDYELRTWNDILSNHDRDHFIGINHLEPFARKRLADLGMDDLDHQEILRLRFGGKLRLWGFKEDDIFRILWWDPHHEVVPSPKKHT